MAVADAAQDSKAKVPPEVIMASRIKQWGDPWGGGWMTWPAGVITRLAIAENITTALRSASNVKPGQYTGWEASHPQDAKTADEILALRIWKDEHPEEWDLHDNYARLKAIIEKGDNGN